jgi:hypothetical protein
MTKPLTKREYIAALAMQGIVSNKDYLFSIQEDYREHKDNTFEWVGYMAMRHADALLSELSKTTDD